MLRIKDIQEAKRRIDKHIKHTALLYSEALSNLTGARVWLKLENEQKTGSFKVRGALNKILKSDSTGPFYTASTGNHALGFAYALKTANKSGKIFLPENTGLNKIQKLNMFDVELSFYGLGCLETEVYTKKLAEKNKAIWVSPYNDQDIIAGQGTIGLEIIEDNDNIDFVFGCIGGGGMMSGVGLAIKSVSEKAKFIGCLPANAPEMYLSIKENRFVDYPPKETLSDGSAGGFEKGAITYDMCKSLVNDYILVSEDEIASGIKCIWENHQLIIEGAAGVTVSAFLKEAEKYQNKNVVLILCGGNIDENLHQQIRTS